MVKKETHHCKNILHHTSLDGPGRAAQNVSWNSEDFLLYLKFIF